MNPILKTHWAVRIQGNTRSIVSNTARLGYAEFWTPDTYALLYVCQDPSRRWRYAVVKRLCTSVHFTTVASGFLTPVGAQDWLLAHAVRLRPRRGVLPVKYLT